MNRYTALEFSDQLDRFELAVRRGEPQVNGSPPWSQRELLMQMIGDTVYLRDNAETMLYEIRVADHKRMAAEQSAKITDQLEEAK